MRPRIKTKTRIGQLVASTNTIQYECIKALTIEHHYNELNFKRIRRIVVDN